MDLVIFDIDYTLIPVDSSKLWNTYVYDQGLVEADDHMHRLKQYNHAYHQGKLDIDAYQKFTMQTFTRQCRETLIEVRDNFYRGIIEPIIPVEAERLLTQHKARGDHRVLLSATNRFITYPLHQRWQTETDLSTKPEQDSQGFTGRVCGDPSYGIGKLTNVQKWLQSQSQTFRQIVFYSDSHTDMPLMEWVDRPVAVNPDPILKSRAECEDWEIISLP